MLLICKTILTELKKRAAVSTAAAAGKTGDMRKFCTFFVDKIVRKAMHGILSP